jgi:trehalose 6-phosphate phosphatase
VRVDEAVAQALPRLARELGGALALVTGRAITSADLLFPGLELAMAGQHGCERRDAAGAIHLHAPRKETYARLCKLFRALAKRHPELLIEDKGAAIALHYRAVPQLASHVHRTLRKSIREAVGYELQAGKMLLEVRPEGRDKGAAIDDFMAETPFAGRLPGVRGRRPDRRARLRDGRAARRMDDQGRRRAHHGSLSAAPASAAVTHWLKAPIADEAPETMPAGQ